MILTTVALTLWVAQAQVPAPEPSARPPEAQPEVAPSDPRPVPPGPPPVPPPPPNAVRVAAQVPAPPPAAVPPPPQSPPWYQRITVGGFARLGLFYTLPPTQEQLVGGNGGFRMADFRLSVEFKPQERFTVFASVEFAAPVASVDDPLVGHRFVDLRDGYVDWDAHDWLQVRVGQFRPHFFAELLLSDGLVPFVGRSILSQGAAPPDAYGPRQALAPDRQLGLAAFSKRKGSRVVGFKYAVGLFNGNGQNQLFNDNNLPMPTARIEVDLFEKVTFGLNGLFNVTASGARPNRLYTNALSYGLDVEGRHRGLSVLLSFLGKNSRFSFAGLPVEDAFGVLGQVRYFHEPTGLEFAARGAWYEPSTAQVADQALEIAGMVGWKPVGSPARLLIQYTHRGEEANVAFMNDSVDLMLHAVW